ncbi:hypothetical protein ACFGVR_22970 [Mucilaginibacter sp. AW1-3]
MKKTKLLLLAMVFAALLFGFNKARADNTVHVVLKSWSNNIAYWETSTSWTVTLHNNTTSEDYTFYTSWYNLYDDGYHLGSVSPGTYTVTVNYYNSQVYSYPFDWYINDESNSRTMDGGTDYTLTSTVYATNDLDYINPNNIGLNIYLFAG